MVSEVSTDATHSFSSPRQQAVQRSLTASYAEAEEPASSSPPLTPLLRRR